MEQMVTPFGRISILVNNAEVNYSLSELPQVTKRYHVDKRYRVAINTAYLCKTCKTINIICSVVAPPELQYTSGRETGENLALVSLWAKGAKMSIGTIGDIASIKYMYLSNGISLVIPQHELPNEILFCVAWVTGSNIDYFGETSTWLAADPNYMI